MVGPRYKTRVNNTRLPIHLRKMTVRGGGLYLHGQKGLGLVLHGRSIGSFFKGIWNGIKSFILPNAKNLIKKHGPSVVKGLTSAAVDNAPAIVDGLLSKTNMSAANRKKISDLSGTVANQGKTMLDKGAQDLIRKTLGNGLQLHSIKGSGLKRI